MQTFEAAEALEFEFAQTHARDARRAFDIGECANRLVEHQRHGRDRRDRRIGVPIVGIAWLLEQFDPSRIERRGKLHAVVAVEGAIGIEPQRRAVADRLLDDVDAREIRRDILADFHLEGAETLRQPGFDFLFDAGLIERIDGRQQRQRRIAVALKQRMIFEHFDSAGEGRGRNLAVLEMRQHGGFGALGILPEHLRNAFAHKGPATFARFRAGARRNMAVGKAGAAAVVCNFDEIGLEFLEGPIRQAGKAGSAAGADAAAISALFSALTTTLPCSDRRGRIVAWPGQKCACSWPRI